MGRSVQALAAALALMIGACDAIPDWFGEPAKPPLPGERISVLEVDAAPRADPTVSDLAVRLPRPRLNSPLKKALLTGFHSTAKHNATKAVSPSSETMRTI